MVDIDNQQSTMVNHGWNRQPIVNHGQPIYTCQHAQQWLNHNQPYLSYFNIDILTQ